MIYEVIEVIKFSEMSDCEYLFCEDEFVQKEEILDEIDEYRNSNFFTAVECKVEFGVDDTKDMLEGLSECVACDNELWEEWDCEFMKQVTDEDLEQITEVINRIIKRAPTCYIPGEEIEFDM